MTKPSWCRCGHTLGGQYQCLNGRVYGPCEDECCPGVCLDVFGYCRGDGACACPPDDDPTNSDDPDDPVEGTEDAESAKG